jgi:hypothetical protein
MDEKQKTINLEIGAFLRSNKRITEQLLFELKKQVGDSIDFINPSKEYYRLGQNSIIKLILEFINFNADDDNGE